MLQIRNYVRVKSLEEAYELNRKKSSCILGGMLWLRLSSRTIDTAIDLSDLGLDRIEETDDSFSIGAMVTLRALEQHEALNRFLNNAPQKAVKDIVGVQFRNMATVGGSIWGRFGFSDVLTVFLAADSYVELYKGGIIPLAQFASMPHDGDILVRLIVKKTPCSISYQAVRGQKTDFPILTCAVSFRNGIYYAVIGARPRRAVIAAETTVPDELAAMAAGQAETGSNLRGSADYRRHLVRVLTERGLCEIGGSKS